MVERLPQLLSAAEHAGHRYDWVLILGGINDIGCDGEGALVFQGLQSMYEVTSG